MDFEYAQTGNHAFLRQQNLAGIMHLLYENAPISRVELSRLTGLNKTTVSSLISELIENQFVREVGTGEDKRAGRRSVLLDLNPGRGFILSGELGVDFISIICTDFTPRVIWRHKEDIPAQANQEDILRRIIKLLEKGRTAGFKKSDTLLGVALALPGLVDQKSGALLFAPNLGWRDVPLAEVLHAAMGTQVVVVDNEATLAALGEQYFGAAEGHSEVLYLSVGAGLGGGLVVRGRLYNGATGLAGEFGHMTVDPHGELCRCGNRGCWETLVSQAALFRRIERMLAGGAVSSLAAVLHNPDERLSIPLITEAAGAGDAVAQEALLQVGHYLGIGIASLVNALNPSLVVLGGALSVAGEVILPSANEELHRRAFHWTEEKVRVVLARYGFDAAVMGGVAKVFQNVIANPLRLG